ncbi:MAG: hypothetical protein ACK4V2_07350 [Pseudomonadota bacterium]|nr:hypothetical protein [Alphaproteobacteria bacterium]
MEKYTKKSITLSFSEQQFIEFLYGTERAKDLMKIKNVKEQDYYRKVYNNWKNGKKYTWNWGACFFNNLWMVYRGLFLGVVLENSIFMLLPKNTVVILSAIMFFVLGFFGNTFLKYLFEYQLRKKANKKVCHAQFDSLATSLAIVALVMNFFSPVLKVFITQTHMEIIELTFFVVIPLFLHLYYYHIKQAG